MRIIHESHVQQEVTKSRFPEGSEKKKFSFSSSFFFFICCFGFLSYWKSIIKVKKKTPHIKWINRLERPSCRRGVSMDASQPHSVLFVNSILKITLVAFFVGKWDILAWDGLSFFCPGFITKKKSHHKASQASNQCWSPDLDPERCTEIQTSDMSIQCVVVL